MTQYIMKREQGGEISQSSINFSRFLQNCSLLSHPSSLLSLLGNTKKNVIAST